MIYTLPTIVKRVSFNVRDNITTSSLDPTVLASVIDQAQDSLTDAILDIRPDILSTYADLTLTGALEYRLSDIVSSQYESILMVEDVTGTDMHGRTSATEWADRMDYFSSDIVPTDEPWAIRDDFIEFNRLPNNATMRIWYTRRPVGLFYGTAGGGASTSVIFPTTATLGEVIHADDYYIGMKVCYANQVRRITDYVASTKTATVTPAWGTAPTGTSEISLVSPLPDRYHPLIVDIASRIIKIGLDDDDSLIRQAIMESTTTMTSRLTKAQSQSPQFIRKISRR